MNDPAETPAVRTEDRWAERGACNDSHPDLFFEPVNYTQAVLVCRRCPVRDTCLHEAIDEPHGVWGGTTPADRGFKEHATGRRIGRPPSGHRDTIAAVVTDQWEPTARIAELAGTGDDTTREQLNALRLLGRVDRRTAPHHRYARRHEWRTSQ